VSTSLAIGGGGEKVFAMGVRFFFIAIALLAIAAVAFLIIATA
jgi:hypothetical protein